MKKRFLFTVFFVGFALFFSIAQEPTSTEPSTETTTETLKEAIEKLIEEEYVRIPKKDFDAIVEHQISERVNKKFNNLLYLLGAIIALLSTFSIIQANRAKNALREHIDTRINNDTAKAVNTIKDDYIKSIEPKMESLKLELKNEDVHIKNSIDTIKNEVTQQLQSIEQQNEQTKRQVSRAEAYLTNLEIQELSNKVAQKTYSDEDIERGLQIIKDIESSNANLFQIPIVISHLSVILYNKRRDTQLIKLISEYEKKYTLKGNVYVNGALIALEEYHNYASSREKRDIALEFLEKSLRATEGYGIAMAVKLEIYMMDHLRAKNDAERKTASEHAETVIHDILNSGSDIPAYETINRLTIDFKQSSYTNYVDQLYTLFSDKMDEMLVRANAYCEAHKIKPYTLSEITTQTD
jgi:hypothetical protein